jgi:3-deoxy-D-manno-octulosonic-acid transferase
MQLISLLFYNLSIWLYGVGILIASFFNAKARLWLHGRRNRGPVELPVNTGKRIWVHCASLGEFEQARPVIERIKNDSSSAFIILTFFSPSGYEVRKNYKYADVVLYLPTDTAKNASGFLDQVKPDLALFVKYEFWYHYLTGLKNRKIPVVLFSAIFRKEQVFFTWYGGFFRNMLRCFSKIFVQNKESQQLLKNISIQSEVSFDTRFDRVYQIAQNPKSFPAIEKFKGNNKLLVAGSTWKKDEQIISTLINQKVLTGFKYVIAPHNIDETEIAAFQKNEVTNSIRLSQLTIANAENADVIIVDTMGDLTSIYNYADIAYVGGGFNASVHNVLEPAVYGMPVIFGPNYSKSAEAKELRQLSAAFPVSDDKQLKAVLTGFVNNTELMKNASHQAKQYVYAHLGGVDDICNYIKPCY